MKIYIKNNKPLFWISLIFFFLFSCLFGVQWFKTSENIHGIQDRILQNFDTIKAIKKSGGFQIEVERLNKRQVVINPKEIEKINNHINYLSDHVFDESNKTQQLIDKDIDRLNLYMAIGIGFMTILGIFVPILINVLNYQDIKDKQKRIDLDLLRIENHLKTMPKKIDQAVSDSKQAISDSEKAKNDSKNALEIIEPIIERVKTLDESMQNIDKEIKESFPKVSMLTLQNAIIRYFYVAPYIMTNLIREKDEDSVIVLIESIRNGFDECKKHSSLDDKNLQLTINDFVIYLREPRFHSSFLNERISNEFFDLSNILLSLLKDKNPKDYQEIDDKLNNIITSIKKYNVETEPAT